MNLHLSRGEVRQLIALLARAPASETLRWQHRALRLRLTLERELARAEWSDDKRFFVDQGGRRDGDARRQ